jgi:hypothetical protein
MRPFYETEEDLSNEAKVVMRLIEQWGGGIVSVSKLPLKYGADFAIHQTDDFAIHQTGERVKDRIKAVLEVKCTSYRSDQYDNYMISLHKAERCMAFAKQMGVNAILAVKFSDSLIGYVSLNKVEDAYYRMGGRFDRNDPDDVELMMHIPIDPNFVFIKESE